LTRTWTNRASSASLILQHTYIVDYDRSIELSFYFYILFDFLCAWKKEILLVTFRYRLPSSQVIYLECFCCILLALFYNVQWYSLCFSHKKYKARFESVLSLILLYFGHWYLLCHIAMTTRSSMKLHSDMNLVVLKLYPTIYKLLLLRISQRLWRLDLGKHAHFINRNGWSMKMKNFNTSVSCRHFMGNDGRSSTVRKWPHLLMLESKENQLLLLISRTQVW